MSKKILTDDGEIIDAPIPSTGVMFFKTPYNHDRDQESDRTGLACQDLSRTQQQFANDADINVILAKFMKTGELTTTGAPNYQNIEEEFDLQRQMVTAWEVEVAWNKLPVAVRNILKDPKTFADYVTHCLETGDLDPLRELGLANPKPPEPTTPPGGTPAPGPSETASPEAVKAPVAP